MKKIISSLLVIVLLMSAVATCFPSAGASVTHGYLLGDANDDNVINIKDVLLVRKYVASVLSDKEINLLAADVSTDGIISLKDVLSIRKAVAGIIKLGSNNSDEMYRVDRITIGNRNIARYTVVLDTEDERTTYASKELVKYIKSACGVNLSVTSDESRVPGCKIKYVYDTENEYELGREGYRVVLEDSGDLVMYCGSLRGPIYATYFLLEQFGWRFLPALESWNGDDYAYVYKSENAHIDENFDTTEVPVFNYRAIGQGGCNTENIVMLRANAVDGSGSNGINHATGGGEGALYIHGHSFAYLMVAPEDRYNSSAVASHASDQPCLTSDETFNTMYTYCVDLMEERKAWGRGEFGIDYTQISCSPNDNTNFCPCSTCKYIYQVEGSVGGTIFRFVNRLAEALDEYCPGIEVFTIAHWEARMPTKYTRPNDNVIVCFRLGGCNNHSLLDAAECAACGGNPRLQDERGNNLSNAVDTELYDAWSELSSNLYAWYCSDNLSYYIAASPNIYNMYEDFRYMAMTGTRGVYCEGSDRPYYAFENLRGYLISKMMWDPFMSEEEFNSHIDEYLSIWYGEGWEYIKEYLVLENNASDELGCFRNNFDRPWHIYNEEFFRENYDRLRDLFAKASDATDDERIKRRIDITKLHCDFFGLSATYERDYVNGDTASKEKYAGCYAELWNAFEKYDVKMTNWGDGKHAANNFPKKQSDIYNPMCWIIDDFSGYWEWNGSGWV